MNWDYSLASGNPEPAPGTPALAGGLRGRCPGAVAPCSSQGQALGARFRGHDENVGNSCVHFDPRPGVNPVGAARDLRG
jgi:hypothetical protein